jgi:hypothetical protein
MMSLQLRFSIPNPTTNTTIVLKSIDPLQGNNDRIDKTCPNQGVLNYGNLTEIWQIFVTLDKLLSIQTFFCQLSVILDNFLSIFCSLGHLDSDMFLSIWPLFPCSDLSLITKKHSITIMDRPILMTLNNFQLAKHILDYEQRLLVLLEWPNTWFLKCIPHLTTSALTRLRLHGIDLKWLGT